MVLSMSALSALAFVAVPLLGGWLSGRSTRKGMNWYASLQRPRWTPPQWVFGPVWTALYVSMGYAAWRVWLRAGWGAALAFFALQLLLNMAWSELFFVRHDLRAATLDVFALLVVLLGMTASYASVDATAAWLTVPYVAWVAFAAALTKTTWSLHYYRDRRMS